MTAALEQFHNAAQVFAEAAVWKEFVVHHYRSEIAEAMLLRIVMMGSDSVFIEQTNLLARDLGCSLREASMILWPTSNAIYRAANAAAKEAVDA